MKHDGLGDSYKAFEAEAAEKLDAFNAELSGTVSGRMERFGVGPESKAAGLEGAKAKRATERFLYIASAAAYQQQVSFRFGGQDVSMSLGDLRSVASDLRNKHRGTDKAAAYDGLLRLIDDVAAGNASPEEIAEYMEEHNLGQDIADAASDDPTITATITNSRVEETAQAGTSADLTASERNADFIGNLF